MTVSANVQVGTAGPCPSGWVIHLGTGKIANVLVQPSCDQYLAIGEQGGGVIKATSHHAASHTPSSRHWIVQFRAGFTIIPCGNEYVSFRQQCSSVKLAAYMQTA